jgi:hypothetical protein
MGEAPGTPDAGGAPDLEEDESVAPLVAPERDFFRREGSIVVF